MELVWAALVLSLVLFSLRVCWWLPVRDGVPVLMYHNVSRKEVRFPKIKRDLTVLEQDFRRQLRFLQESGRKTVTFVDLLTGDIPGDKPVIITFDDAYRGCIEIALPILYEFGMKAVLFVPAGLMGEKIGYEKHGLLFDVMSRDEVRRWSDLGFEVGSHGMYHRNFTELSREEKIRELSESRSLLGKVTGCDPVAFSFPYGRYSEEDVILAREQGYEFVNIIGRRIWSGPNESPVPRVYVKGNDTMFDFNLSLTRGKSRI